MSNQVMIETTVTFSDGTVHGMKVSVSTDLYVAAEIPDLIDDTMRRGARAINQKIKDHNQ